MKHTILTLIAGTALLSASSPAFADKRTPSYDEHRYSHVDWTDPYDRRYDPRDHRYNPDYRWRTVNAYSSYPVTSYREVRCTNSTNPLGLIVGGVAGGAVGSAIGSGVGRVAAIAGGALVGSMIGNRAMVRENCTEQVFHEAPIGRPISWADSSQAYTVVPVREYTYDNRYCREYQAYALVGDQRSETYGTACQQPDGTWLIVN